MSKKKKLSLVALIVIIASLVTCAYKIDNDQKTKNAHGPTIIIGSKNFTESKIIMQIWADALEKEGINVTTKPNISSSVVYQAIKANQISLYPEYTGTIALTYLNKNIVGKNADQIALIAKNGVKKEGLSILAYAPGNDAQGIAIRTRVAKKYGINNISDLQKKANKIRFVSQGEFDKREDGLPGLQEVYGKFKFKSHEVYDPSLKYQILEKGEGDITPASTTEGQLATKKFFTLADNKHFWPAYNLVPLVRESTLRANPKIEYILNKIDRKLTTKELRSLNKEVDIDGRSYQSVAKEWIEKNY